MEVNPDEVHTFTSPDEYRGRPMYRTDIVAKGIRPSRIVGSYRFRDPVCCGIQGCSQIHTHGYVVLNTDGTETNTGWDCGLDHFGVEFFEMRRVYDRVEREQPFRQTLRELKANVDELLSEIRSMQGRQYGGEWLRRNLRSFAKLYPRPVVELARKHAKTGEVRVHSGQTRGTVRGLKVFTSDPENWPLAALEAEIAKFAGFDPDHAEIADVRRWCDWAKTLESRMEECESLLDEGMRFFRRDNLALLQFLMDDKDSQEQLSWMVWSNDTGTAASSTSTQPQRDKAWQRMLKRLTMTNN